MSNPIWFTEEKDSTFGYAFWHFRYTAYSGNAPHRGYDILRDICAAKEASHGLGGFSFTSNIDGHWLKCGYNPDRIIEVHGSVHFFQCIDLECSESNSGVWDVVPNVYNEMNISADNRVTTPLPKCPSCSKLARPNVFMFGDGTWNDERYIVQRKKSG